MKKILRALKIFSILSLSACGAGTPPKYDGKFWAGDSKRESIRRSQESQEILCKSPDFDSYVCMTYSDLRKFYDTFVLKCEKWPEGAERMTFSEAMDHIGALRGKITFK
jgi:hypothetical protein